MEIKQIAPSFGTNFFQSHLQLLFENKTGNHLKRVSDMQQCYVSDILHTTGERNFSLVVTICKYLNFKISQFILGTRYFECDKKPFSFSAKFMFSIYDRYVLIRIKYTKQYVSVFQEFHYVNMLHKRTMFRQIIEL